MKKILALLIAVCMMAGVFGSAVTVSADEVFELNVSFASPEFTTMGITASLDRIAEASEGRIKFNYYYSWSLSSVPTVVDDLSYGVVDIAAVPVNEHLNLFPYSNLITYTPFLPLKGMRTTAKAFMEMYREYDVLQQEYENLGLHYWTNYPCPPYHIFTTEDKQIRKPEDIAGLKLITSSRMMSEFLSANGGAVVNSPVTDYATNLNTNVVDGVINHANVLAAFGCMDFIGGVTRFGESGTAMSLMMLCISGDTWNRLPDDLKALFDEEADRLLEEQCTVDEGMQEANFAALQEKGVPIIDLTEEEIQVWRDSFAEMLDGYISELEAGGADQARAVYDAFLAKIEAE